MNSVSKADVTVGRTEEGRRNRVNSESPVTFRVCSVSKVDITGGKTEEGNTGGIT